VVARKESSAKGQKEVFKARLDSTFDEAASEVDEAPNRKFTIMQSSGYGDYCEWRHEEDSGRKEMLKNALPLNLIEIVKKPLPPYLEEMADAGCFVDADFPLPEDIFDLGSGLTQGGYVIDEDSKAAQERDFHYLQQMFAGETILLN
jgi:hypothetical protein